eukprot:8514175-Pyramimonas_sp.AAC.1
MAVDTGSEPEPEAEAEAEVDESDGNHPFPDNAGHHWWLSPTSPAGSSTIVESSASAVDPPAWLIEIPALHDAIAAACGYDWPKLVCEPATTSPTSTPTHLTLGPSPSEHPVESPGSV